MYIYEYIYYITCLYYNDCQIIIKGAHQVCSFFSHENYGGMGGRLAYRS